MKTFPEPGAGTLLVVILTTCLLLFLSQQIVWLVLPVLVALVLYYVLRPVKDALVICGVRNESAAKVVWILLQLISVAGLLVVAFLFQAKAAAWQETFPQSVAGGAGLLRKTLQSLETAFPLFKKMSLGQQIDHSLQQSSGQFVEKNLLPLTLQLLKLVPSLLLVPYITFFMLQDSTRLKKYIIKSVPNAFFEKALLLFSRLDDSLQNYFQGLLVLTLLDAGCLSLGLALLGIDSALGLGLAAAVLAWIPYLGSIVGCVIVVLVAAVEYPEHAWKAYACLILFLAVRLLDDFVFLPITIGRKLHVHPLLSVLMLFLGATVAGPTGLVLALPMFGLVAVVGEAASQVVTDKRLRARYKASRLLATPTYGPDPQRPDGAAI
jgi:predicted PurR-regulated permease PerM